MHNFQSDREGTQGIIREHSSMNYKTITLSEKKKKSYDDTLYDWKAKPQW